MNAATGKFVPYAAVTVSRARKYGVICHTSCLNLPSLTHRYNFFC